MSDRTTHFQPNAAGYAAGRPTYPPQLASVLATFSPDRKLAVDVGAGSGQLTAQLANHFDRVIGVDVSQAQLSKAPANPRIDWKLGDASHLPVADGSASLVVAAQAAHWFDLPAFYAEARRVARPGALLALITYGPAQVDGVLADRFSQFYSTEIRPFWPAERSHVETGYRDLPFPFARLAMPSLSIDVTWPLARFLVYINSWSAARAPGADAVITAFQDDALAVMQEDADLTVHFPLTVIAGRLA